MNEKQGKVLENKRKSAYSFKTSSSSFSLNYNALPIPEFILYVRKLMYDVVATKKTSYINLSSAFDIETSNFYVDDNKCCFMYCWQFGINGTVTMGRTWEQFQQLLNELTDIFQLSIDRKLIIYVHNLSFEFSFFKHLFEWENVFCLRKNKPIFAITTSGIEFRCSYILSNYSLETIGNNLLKYKVYKLTGELDYSLIRHQKTILTKKENQYCINDVLVVMAYIQEKIENEGNIALLKLTNTGYVRKFCQNACYKDVTKNYKYLRYRSLMLSMQMTPKLYKYCLRAFQGGFAHGSTKYMFKTVYHLGGVDFSSSYPAVMLMFKFPTGTPKYFDGVENAEFLKMIKSYCCIFNIRFTNIRPKIIEENYLASSKCYDLVNAVKNNGRIVSADSLTTTITEVDFEIIKEFYDFDSFEIGGLYRFYKQYLPTDLIKALLDLYEAKTTLKGIDGKENEYMNKKGMLNSTYGMMVTNIVQDLVTFDKDWVVEEPDIEEAIEKYNQSKSRFLYYPWGIYVTAYARKNLLIGFGEDTFCVKNCIEDFVYADTDSIKFKNPEKYKNMIYNYNLMVEHYTLKALEHHKLNFNLSRPKTKKGIEKPIGVWDIEAGIDKPEYTIFKTLGAKRYMYMQDGHITMTVSGVNKKIALPYLLNKYGRYGIFENFNEELYIPKGLSGKLTHTYIDEPMQGMVKDYKGNIYEFYERSGTHLEPSDYDFSISEEFKKYIMGLETYYN